MRIPCACSIAFFCFSVMIWDTAHADTRAGFETGKLFVTNIRGNVHAETSNQPIRLRSNEVVTPENFRVRTDAGSAMAMVLSNGTGLFVYEQSDLEIGEFSQVPFVSQPGLQEMEPSVSRSAFSLNSGRLALCNSQFAPETRMQVMTPLGILGINGRQLVVESDGENLVVFVIDGNAVLEELGGDTAPVQVNAGQKAVISRTGPGATGAVQVGPMEGAEMQNVARSVSQACRPKRQVFFASSEEDGVDVVPVLPPAPAHVQPVSPDRL